MEEVSVFLNPYFYAWWVICVVQSCVTAWAYLRCFTSKVPKIWIYIVIVIATSNAPIIFKHVLLNFNSLSSILSVLSNIVACMILTHGSKTRILLFFVVNYVLDSMTEIIIHIIYGDLYSSIYAYDPPKVAGTFLFLIISFVLKYLMSEAWIRISRKTTDDHLNWQFVIFPSAQMIACAPIMIQSIWNRNSDLERSVNLVIIGMLIMIVSNVLFLKVISDFERKTALEQTLRDSEYTRSLEEKHYESIEAKRHETEEIRREIRLQISAVKELVAGGNTDGAEAIISGIESRLDLTREHEYCSVPVVNAVIGEKNSICANNGIDFSADISIDGLESVPKNQLCCIFSNLIDNAIKAVVPIDENDRRSISILGRRKGNFLIINCKNSVAKTVPDGKLEPSRSKGYGLKILRDIASHYNGRFDIEIINGICTATVMLESEHT